MITVRNASGRITYEKKVVEQDYCAKLYLKSIIVCFGRANRRTKKKVFKAKEEKRHLTPSQPRYKNKKMNRKLV